MAKPFFKSLLFIVLVMSPIAVGGNLWAASETTLRIAITGNMFGQLFPCEH